MSHFPREPAHQPEPPPLPPEEPVEPAEPESPPAKTNPGLVGVDGDQPGGADCTITDSNGPLEGGTFTDSCPEGQQCVCDRSGGYACAGTCRAAR